MNRKPLDSEISELIAGSLAGVDVPRFDLAATQARRATLAAAKPARSWSPGRMALVALPVALVLVVILATMPSVIAQVQRMLQAFAVVNGQTVPLTVRTLSLEQARTQMPFQVIVPAAVPPALKLTINEMYSESSPADARLVFQYRANGQLPALTISESSATSKGPTKVMVTERSTVGDGGRLVVPPGALHVAPPMDPSVRGQGGYTIRSVEVKDVNGRVSRQSFEMHPIVWVQHGTRIILAATPGTLTPIQVDAIRAAMSR